MSKSQDARRSTNNNKKTERVTFRLSEEEIEEVDRRADRQGYRTRSAFIRDAALGELSNEEEISDAGD